MWTRGQGSSLLRPCWTMRSRASTQCGSACETVEEVWDGINVTITVEDMDEPPGQPTAPEVTHNDHTTLVARWDAPDNWGPEITDYDVQYRQGTDEFQDAGYDGTGTHTNLKELSPGTTYQVQVRAINAEGVGPWSESGTGQTKAVPPTPPATPTPEPTPTVEPVPHTTDEGDGGFPWWRIPVIVVGAIATGVTVVGAHRKWGTNGAPANAARKVALALRSSVRWVATSTSKTLAYDGARVVGWSARTPPGGCCRQGSLGNVRRWEVVGQQLPKNDSTGRDSRCVLSRTMGAQQLSEYDSPRFGQGCANSRRDGPQNRIGGRMPSSLVTSASCPPWLSPTWRRACFPSKKL